MKLIRSQEEVPTSVIVGKWTCSGLGEKKDKKVSSQVLLGRSISPLVLSIESLKAHYIRLSGQDANHAWGLLPDFNVENIYNVDKIWTQTGEVIRG